MKEKIKFLDIYEIIEKAMENHVPYEPENLEIILKARRKKQENGYIAHYGKER